MRDAFTRFLDAKKDATFFLSAAVGNSGDRLLQKGLEEYLLRNNFLVSEQPSEADVILMHGGGSIDDVWGNGIAHLQGLLTAHPEKTIVVAPSTFHFSTTDFSAFLRQYQQEIYLFARERYSLERLRQLELPANVHVTTAHDTAFLLEGTDYLERLRARSTKETVLCAMRTDRESTIVSFDLNEKPYTMLQRMQCWLAALQIRLFLARQHPGVRGLRTVVCRDVSYESFDNFTAEIARTRVIHTDRLHVAILGALLQKPVHVYPTRYDKIHGVYEMSLQRYPSVTFHGSGRSHGRTH